MIDLRGHMPRFTWKMNVFPSISLEMPEMCVWNCQNRARFSEMINLRGHMPRFNWKWKFFHLSPSKCHKCVLKPSAQGSFFWVDWFEGSHVWVYLKNEHFSIYLLRKARNVCCNHQNRACFSQMIDLRGHMPRFTWKMNIFPSIYLATA